MSKIIEKNEWPHFSKSTTKNIKVKNSIISIIFKEFQEVDTLTSNNPLDPTFSLKSTVMRSL